MAINNWRYLVLLHNLSLQVEVGNKYIAAVPTSDPRLLNEHSKPGFTSFVNGFRDQFDRKIYPSVIILREDIKPTLDLIIGFRNALSITAIAQAWMHFLDHDGQLEYFKFSDYFALYPHNLSKDGQYIVVSSPAVDGLDDVNEFCGQATPGISTASPASQFYDDYLLEALLDAWVKKYIRRKGSWENTALFRSLQMAYRASAMPFQNNASFEDYGAQLSLWVSAHEILTRPEQGRASLPEVLNVLGKAHFFHSKAKVKRYKKYVHKKPVQLNLLQKLYFEMYISRNNFLHGNPVTVNDVFPTSRRDRYPLTCFAPIIYRYALYSFLGLWEDNVYEPEMTSERIRRSMYENALIAATGTSSYRKRLRKVRSKN